jgi:hypothetical protein
LTQSTPLKNKEQKMQATEYEAELEYVANVGAEQPDRAWIWSDRDAWYRNPYYTGPAVPHPEQEQDSGGVAADEDPLPF